MVWLRAISAATVTMLRSRGARPGRFQRLSSTTSCRYLSSAGATLRRSSRARASGFGAADSLAGEIAKENNAIAALRSFIFVSFSSAVLLVGNFFHPLDFSSTGGWLCQADRAPGSKVTYAPFVCDGSCAGNSGSTRTEPVKYSTGSLLAGREPLRAMVSGATFD